MPTRAEIIVALWFLPVALQIVLPLTALVFWLLTKPFRGGRLEEPSTINRDMQQGATTASPR